MCPNSQQASTITRSTTRTICLIRPWQKSRVAAASSAQNYGIDHLFRSWKTPHKELKEVLDHVIDRLSKQRDKNKASPCLERANDKNNLDHTEMHAHGCISCVRPEVDRYNFLNNTERITCGICCDDGSEDLNSPECPFAFHANSDGDWQSHSTCCPLCLILRTV